MSDLPSHIDCILDIIDTDLKDILWNSKPSTESWFDDYQIKIRREDEGIIIEIQPRRKR